MAYIVYTIYTPGFANGISKIVTNVDMLSQSNDLLLPTLRDMRKEEKQSRAVMEIMLARKMDETRSEKDILGMLASMLGLFNGVKTHELQTRLDSYDDTARATIKHIDVMGDHINNNADHIYAIEKEMTKDEDLLSKISMAELVEERWMQCKPAIRATRSLVTSAMHHRLDASIMELLDLGKEWESFLQQLKNNGMTPAITNFLHLFQLKVSLLSDGNTVQLISEVPVTDDRAVAMTLWRWIPVPVVIKGLLMDVATTDRWLAVDEETNTTSTMDDYTIEQCTALLDTYYCRTAAVRYSSSAGVCLHAVFMRNWQEVGRRCVLTVRPMDTGVVPIGINTFVITTPMATDILVFCKGKSKRVFHLEVGMSRLDMPRGCSASTTRWTTVEGSRSSATHVIPLNVSDAEGISAAMEKVYTKGNVTVHAPTHVHSVTRELEAKLEAHRWSWIQWLAICLAAIAVIIVVVFVAFLYCKAKGIEMPTGRFALPTWKRGRRHESDIELNETGEQ